MHKYATLFMITPLTCIDSRRSKADELLAFGMSKSAVARELKIDRSTLYRWLNRTDETKAHLGRPFRLKGEAKKAVRILLKNGPSKCGRQGKFWVVSEAVEECKRLGFECSAATMWRLLHRLKLTPKAARAAAHAKALENRRERYRVKNDL